MRKIVTIVYALIATSCLAKPISDSTSFGACIMRDGSFVGINENERFAMHSGVMKFPQALCVADYLSRKGLDLDDTIVVDKADLMQDTWSPMLKQGLQDMNDAGIILMPDGSHVIIAIFTKQSSSEAVIVNIAKQLLERIR